MKKPVKILIGVLITLIVLSFVKDIAIKISVEKGVQLVTGLPLKMSGFRIGIARTLVGIRGLRLFNPNGYPDKIMLSMPEIYVDYNLTPIFKGKVHLQEMRIDMKELAVIKNRDGNVNLDSLKVVQAQKKKKKPQTKGKGGMPDIQIDKLRLKIGKVVYKDYSRGGSPSVQEFDVGVDESYENIKDPYSLVSLILIKSLAGTTVARLAKIDIKGLQNSVSDVLSSASEVTAQAASQAKAAAEETAKKTAEATRQAADKAEAAAKEAADNIQKTADELKDKFKLPFGTTEE